jgi:hypothetical protein
LLLGVVLLLLPVLPLGKPLGRAGLCWRSRIPSLLMMVTGSDMERADWGRLLGAELTGE